MIDPIKLSEDIDKRRAELMERREFEHEGLYYFQMGLYQIWFSPKLTAKADMFADPPRLRQNVQDWLLDHNAELRFDLTGVPTFVFKDVVIRENFKLEFEPITLVEDATSEGRAGVE